MPASRQAPTMAQGLDAAMERITGHEDICALRYEQINRNLSEIATKLSAHDDKFDRLDKAAWSLVGTLGLVALSLIAFLFLQVWPPAGPVRSPPAVTPVSSAHP